MKCQTDQQGNDSPCAGLKRDLSILDCPKFPEIIALAVSVPSNMHTLHWSLQQQLLSQKFSFSAVLVWSV